MDECDIEYPPCECDGPTESSFPPGMEMRPMRPGDLAEVKRLHEQCFPVRYDMAFYENVVRGFIARGKGNDKEPLYTQVAVIPYSGAYGPDGATGGNGSGGSGGLSPWPTSNGSDPRVEGFSADGDDDRLGPGGADGTQENVIRRHSPPAAGPAGAATDGAASCSSDRGDGAALSSRLIWPAATGAGGGDRGGDGAPAGEGDEGHIQSGSDEGREIRESVVGLITCQVMPLDRCRDQDRLGLRPPVYGAGQGGAAVAHSEVVYILTLGTETRYRRQGIGRALLRRCVWLSRQEQSIGAVYLHVITTNPPAHRFYESEGFVQVCCISDYYRIDGKMYDCFLYALFVNGAQPPGEWGWGIQSLSRRLRSIISFFRRTLGHVPEEGKLAKAVAAAGSPPEQATEQPHQHRRDEEEAEGDDDDGGPGSRRAPPAFAAAAAAAGASAAAARRSRGHEAAGCASGDTDGDGAHDGALARGRLLDDQNGGPETGHREEGAATVAVEASLEGGARPTVSLWDAAASGVVVWGKAGALEGRGGMTTFRDEAAEAAGVGSWTIDASSSATGGGGSGGGGRRCWGLGLDPV